MLCQTEMENTKIIIYKKQVMHMLKCQDAAEKLIAFCHKHSLINMITFAYFILLLICCLGDSQCSPAHVPKRKKIYYDATKQALCISSRIFLYQMKNYDNILVSAHTLIGNRGKTNDYDTFNLHMQHLII